MAIRFLLGNMFEIGTLQGERIATPVCGLVRNDREIGPWFLKLMTLPVAGPGFRVLPPFTAPPTTHLLTIPSPGGKGDREAVDEEWRHLPILNAVNSNGTDFPNVPF